MQQETTNEHIIPQAKALDFMTGGNAIVTLVDYSQEIRHTYKLMASENQKYLWIKLLTGPDNTKNYTEIFIFHVDADGLPQLTFRHNNKVNERMPSVQLFRKVFRNLILRPEDDMDWLEIWHVGRCCRCGRTLTVPESIAAGIGPECALLTNQFTI